MYRSDLIYEAVSVTTGNSFALRPCPESTEIILGVYGRALDRYRSVKLHALNPLSNQLTELVSSSDPWQLERYFWYTRSNISKEIKRLHGLPYDIFEKRVSVLPIAPDEDSQVARLRYVLAQGTKENLVKSPRDWLGATGVHQLENDKELHGWWFDRTAESAARRRKETFGKYKYATRYTVKLSPVPAWQDKDDWRGRVTKVVDQIAADRTAEFPGRPLGWHRVVAYSPRHFPKKFKKSRSPMVLAASKPAYDALRRVQRAFNEAFEAAAARLRENPDKDPKFPPYAFPPGAPMTPGPSHGSDDLAFALAPD